ncbi:MAG: hypothetical protein Q9M36_12680 [Sulfurovum sp.]|nr:hypothetical protein [Sulfurovum sp.]
MKKLIASMIVMSMGVVAGDEGILPSRLTVDLPKKCQMLMLHTEADEKSKKIATFASVGDVVENMGCIRGITQKDLDKAPEKERYYLAWKHPVWCKVALGSKQGWVQQKYLKNEEVFEANDE